LPRGHREPLARGAPAAAQQPVAGDHRHRPPRAQLTSALRRPPAYTGVMSTVRMSDQPLDAPEAPSAPQTQTALLERTDTRVEPDLSEPGDHERFSHYVR